MLTFIFFMIVAVLCIFIVPIKLITGDKTEQKPKAKVSYMRCPTCGDRARVIGDRWECEFCCDCGRIQYK